jgi:hypothetical protein
MKAKWLTVFALAAALLPAGGHAQNTTIVPSSPAPTVTTTMPAPGRTIYTARLPAAAELTTAAAAQGLAIDRIEQTATQVTVIYRTSTGATSVVAYQLLPTANATANSGVVTPTPAPVVVEPAPRVVYYDPAYRYYPAYTYDPWYWYPPVSFRFGLGYGFRGGYFRGGFRHGR